MNDLESLTFADGQPITDGQRIRVIRNQGNVIMVKRGDPQRIRSVWDLDRVRLTTLNPDSEPPG